MVGVACTVCRRIMRSGIQCVDRRPLENRALLGDILAAEDDCNDCGAPASGNHHDRCKFLWCKEHDVQYLLCAKDHVTIH